MPLDGLMLTEFPGGSSNAIFGVTLRQLAQISGGTFADVRRDA